jgi:ribonuclease HI
VIQLLNERHSIVGTVTPDYDIARNRGSHFSAYARQAEPDDHSDIDIYTDGSKMNNGSGSAYTIVTNGEEITYGQFKLNQEATVFQAELVALEMAAERIADLKLKGRINIHTDSMSALQALKADHLTSMQAIRTKKALDKAGKPRKVRLKIFWIKAHVGIEFNERADQLAKEATQAGIPHVVEHSRKHLKTRYREHYNAVWKDIWFSSQDRCKRTRVWFPWTSPKTTKILLSKTRDQLSLCVQWFTGFCNLMRHRHKKNRVILDTCRLCRDDVETPEHLTFHCPSLISTRLQHFDTRVGPFVWTVDKLLRFINTNNVRTLLEDTTNYRM